MFDIRNTSITIKVLGFTLIIGILVWSVLDYIQGKAIQQILFAELAADLEIHAKEDRAVFDHYIQTHNQATKIIISQQRFQTYVSIKSMEKYRMVVSRQSEDADGNPVKQWYFRHDKIMEFIGILLLENFHHSFVKQS